MRLEGDVVEVDDALGQLWLERGVVAEAEGETPTKATDETTEQQKAPAGGDAYADYAGETVDEVLAKLDAGTYDPEQVRGLENTRHGGPRKGVLEALGAE